MIRRWYTTNTWSLFWRNCDRCGNRTLSMYPASKNLTVYCESCWWGDSWDGSEYTMDYDPKRPFLEQLRELTEKTPYLALENTHSTLKNCEYSNAIAYSKNCYLVTWADFCENVFYSTILNGLKYSSDCIRGFNSELCYESIGFTNNYQTFFSDECDTCVDVWFSRDCHGCTNCVGCVNLRGATNCIFNVKYSEKEYEAKKKEMRLDSWAGLREVENKAREFWLANPYREYHGHTLNKNVTGEYTFRSRNSKEGYIVNYAENCKYCQFLTVASTKDCMDFSSWGHNAELMYECVQVGDQVSNSKFSASSFPDIVNTEYSFWCTSSKNNFGCANLKRKSYCILNKQYSKEEYAKLKEEIIEGMKKSPYKDEKGREWPYGEFFGLVFGKHGYNDSNAMRFFPKTKKEALNEGFTWNDEENPSLPSTIKDSDLPDTIYKTDESILNEIIECASCKRSYKIVKGELDLLRKIGLPVPHECPKCRENKRFARMTRPKLYHRKCDKCGDPIYTPYAPEDPRIVYCVKDYQAEFL